MIAKKNEIALELAPDSIKKKSLSGKGQKKMLKQTDLAQVKKTSIKTQNNAIFKATLNIIKRTKAKKLFLYIDAFDENMLPERLPDQTQLFLLTKRPDYTYSGPCPIKSVITVPRLKLGRTGMIKIATILALSANLVKPEDKVFFLVGKAETVTIDTLICFCIEEEQELITGHNISDLPKTITPSVFEHTIGLAIELGNQGKEGRPIGTIFVLGDEEKVMQLSRQMIINPFKGYEPDERNILNPALKETVRELASVDGAMIIAGNGEMIAAGRYLGAVTDDAEIPKGLGSRHIAAAGITALTNAVAIVISESTGDVRIFKNGKIIMAIEKPIHK